MKSYTVEDVMTWGVKWDKDYGGYKIPVCFDEKESIVKEIEKLVKKYKANRVFYGDYKTIYFKTWHLTRNQKEIFLDTGKKFVDLTFDVEDVPVESKKKKLYIKLTLTGLRLSSRNDELMAKEEEKKEKLAPKEDF